MTEWPEAPRLREALQRTAAEARTDTPARERLRELLEDGSDEEHHPAPIPSQPAHPSSRRRAPWLWAAAAIVVLLGVATLLTVDGDEEPEAVVSTTTPTASTPDLDGDPTESPASTPTPPPELGAQECRRSVGDPTAFLVAADGVGLEVGIAGGSAGESTIPVPPTFMVVGGASWQRAAAGLPMHTGAGLTTETVYFIPSTFDADQAPTIARTVLASTCGPVSYLLATPDGYTAATDLACARIPAQGFSGFAFIDPGPPPTGCALAHPVIIVTSDPLASSAQWEAHQGCTGPATTTDDDGNLVTTYGACDNTLIIVDTATSDPLAAVVDGAPTAEFLTRLRGIAN